MPGIDYMRIILSDTEEFTSIIESLDADECEHHARQIVKNLEGPSFENYLLKIVQVAIPNQGHPSKSINPYYKVTKGTYPGVRPEDDILGRLASLVLKMIVLRIEAGRKKR
jgi:hypothetical protein